MLDIWGARKIAHRNANHLLVIGELLTVANKIYHSNTYLAKELGPDQPDIKIENEYNHDRHDRQRQYRYATGRRSPDWGEKHNEEVDKNRHVLSKIIDCV